MRGFHKKAGKITVNESRASMSVSFRVHHGAVLLSRGPLCIRTLQIIDWRSTGPWDSSLACKSYTCRIEGVLLLQSSPTSRIQPTAHSDATISRRHFWNIVTKKALGRDSHNADHVPPQKHWISILDARDRT